MRACLSYDTLRSSRAYGRAARGNSPNSREITSALFWKLIHRVR